MALCVNDSGTWREISTLCVNQSGTWREISTGCINQSGTWREFGMAANIAAAALGDNVEGGYLICKTGSGLAWIVAPASTEVGRTWPSRNDAVTTANANEACGDWFVPTVSQLNTIGQPNNQYWDSYSPGYWSSSNRAACVPNGNAWTVNMGFQFLWYSPHPFSVCVRAFRCVSY